jgi:micrococcal nuclease
MMKIAFLFTLLFLFPLYEQPIQSQSEWVEVSKFVDGDTFWITNTKGQQEKIRLIGVDAPESRRSGRKEIGYYGKEASAYVERMLDGKKIRLEYDVGKYDRYKRTLAYVYLQDGTFLNAHLVENGYAMVMTVPPNVKYADLFVSLQKEARKKKKGLWSMP